MLSKTDQTKSNRLRPVEDMDLYDQNIVVRFDKAEYKKRQDFVREYECCQICGEYGNLDTPHFTG